MNPSSRCLFVLSPLTHGLSACIGEKGWLRAWKQSNQVTASHLDVVFAID